jgi:hypothetical protein
VEGRLFWVDAAASVVPELPLVAAFSNAVPSTVGTSFASFDWTVAIELSA